MKKNNKTQQLSPEHKRMILSLYNEVISIRYTQIKENAASYATKRRGNTIYLYFEASNGVIDWLNNFDFPAKPYRKMENLWFAHRGFLRVWKTIEDYVSPLINDPTIEKIIIAGYSHGAAIALLCHEFCVFNRPDIEKMILGYGFGCPRVVWGWTNKKVKSRFKQFYVIRNCKDIVTHLPPVVFGFKHVGNFTRIGVDAKYGLIDSHRPEKYIRELKNWAGVDNSS